MAGSRRSSSSKGSSMKNRFAGAFKNAMLRRMTTQKSNKIIEEGDEEEEEESKNVAILEEVDLEEDPDNLAHMYDVIGLSED